MNSLIVFLMVYVVLLVLFFFLYKMDYQKGRISTGMIIFQISMFHLFVLVNMIVMVKHEFG